MGQSLERVNVSFSKEDLKEAKNYCKKLGISFSEFVRTTVMKEVEERENMDLLDFIIKNTPVASKEEQQEFEEFFKSHSYNEEDFREVTLDEILQG